MILAPFSKGEVKGKGDFSPFFKGGSRR